MVVLPNSAILEIERIRPIDRNTGPVGLLKPHPLEGLDSHHGPPEQVFKQRLVKLLHLLPRNRVLTEFTLEEDEPLGLDNEVVRLGIAAAIPVLEHEPEVGVQFPLNPTLPDGLGKKDPEFILECNSLRVAAFEFAGAWVWIPVRQTDPLQVLYDPRFRHQESPSVRGCRISMAERDWLFARRLISSSSSGETVRPGLAAGSEARGASPPTESLTSSIRCPLPTGSGSVGSRSWSSAGPVVPGSWKRWRIETEASCSTSL